MIINQKWAIIKLLCTSPAQIQNELYHICHVYFVVDTYISDYDLPSYHVNLQWHYHYTRSSLLEMKESYKNIFRCVKCMSTSFFNIYRSCLRPVIYFRCSDALLDIHSCDNNNFHGRLYVPKSRSMMDINRGKGH